jgi:hypothetical protein
MKAPGDSPIFLDVPAYAAVEAEISRNFRAAACSINGMKKIEIFFTWLFRNPVAPPFFLLRWG